MSGTDVQVRASEVTLERFVWSSCGDLLGAWLRRPHVNRWWRETEHWREQIRTTADEGHAIIAVSGRPVGYVRWQSVNRRVLDDLGLSEIPSGGVDIDLFVGEPEWLGRGVGPTALRTLLARLGDEGVPLAGLCPSVENLVAIRAFEKAGFRKFRQFDDPSVGRCWVLTTEPRPSTPASE